MSVADSPNPPLGQTDDQPGGDVAPTANPVEAPAFKVDHEIIGETVRGSARVSEFRTREVV